MLHEVDDWLKHSVRVT